MITDLPQLHKRSQNQSFFLYVPYRCWSWKPAHEQQQSLPLKPRLRHPLCNNSNLLFENPLVKNKTESAPSNGPNLSFTSTYMIPRVSTISSVLAPHKTTPEKNQQFFSGVSFSTSRAACLDADAGECRNIHLSLNKCTHAHRQEHSGGG